MRQDRSDASVGVEALDALLNGCIAETWTGSCGLSVLLDPPLCPGETLVLCRFFSIIFVFFSPSPHVVAYLSSHNRSGLGRRVV
jgi:hypothetical protein